MVDSTILWYPLFEASAQTIIGAVSQYVGSKIVSRIFRNSHFVGAQDLWYRGIMTKKVEEGDRISIEGSLSCFVQVFPGNPFNNAERWNHLYDFTGKIDNQAFQTLDFAAGSDSALRVGSVNGEAVVGIYNQYGYVGEGILGVVPNNTLLKAIPNALDERFIVKRVLIGGRLARCPSQHGFVIQSLCRKAGLNLKLPDYEKLWYVLIDWIKPFNKEDQKYVSLLGSPWAATGDKEHQYILTYGQMDNPEERKKCLKGIRSSPLWKKASVYYDDIECPSRDLSFKRMFF